MATTPAPYAPAPAPAAAAPVPVIAPPAAAGSSGSPSPSVIGVHPPASTAASASAPPAAAAAAAVGGVDPAANSNTNVVSLAEAARSVKQHYVLIRHVTLTVPAACSASKFDCAQVRFKKDKDANIWTARRPLPADFATANTNKALELGHGIGTIPLTNLEQKASVALFLRRATGVCVAANGTKTALTAHQWVHEKQIERLLPTVAAPAASVDLVIPAKGKTYPSDAVWQEQKFQFAVDTSFGVVPTATISVSVQLEIVSAPPRVPDKMLRCVLIVHDPTTAAATAAGAARQPPQERKAFDASLQLGPPQQVPTAVGTPPTFVVPPQVVWPDRPLLAEYSVGVAFAPGTESPRCIGAAGVPVKAEFVERTANGKPGGVRESIALELRSLLEWRAGEFDCYDEAERRVIHLTVPAMKRAALPGLEAEMEVTLVNRQMMMSPPPAAAPAAVAAAPPVAPAAAAAAAPAGAVTASAPPSNAANTAATNAAASVPAPAPAAGNKAVPIAGTSAPAVGAPAPGVTNTTNTNTVGASAPGAPVASNIATGASPPGTPSRQGNNTPPATTNASPAPSPLSNSASPVSNAAATTNTAAANNNNNNSPGTNRAAPAAPASPPPAAGASSPSQPNAAPGTAPAPAASPAVAPLSPRTIVSPVSASSANASASPQQSPAAGSGAAHVAPSPTGNANNGSNSAAPGSASRWPSVTAVTAPANNGGASFPSASPSRMPPEQQAKVDSVRRQLSPKQINDIVASFGAHDTNRDGFLDATELRLAVKTALQSGNPANQTITNASDAQVNTIAAELLAAADTNRDGRLSVAELRDAFCPPDDPATRALKAAQRASAVEAVKAEMMEDEIQRIMVNFTLFDRTGDGQLDASELDAAVRTVLGGNMADKRKVDKLVNAIMAAADESGDGLLSISELRNAFCAPDPRVVAEYEAALRMQQQQKQQVLGEPLHVVAARRRQQKAAQLESVRKRLLDNEMREILRNFAVFDVSGDGNLNRSELEQAVRSVLSNGAMSDAQSVRRLIDDMIAACDEDNDGLISVAELQAALAFDPRVEAERAAKQRRDAMAAVREQLMSDEIQRILSNFASFDRNGDGVLDRQELDAAVRTVLAQSRVAQNKITALVEQLLVACDEDSDGRLSTNELRLALATDSRPVAPAATASAPLAQRSDPSANRAQNSGAAPQYYRDPSVSSSIANAPMQDGHYSPASSYLYNGGARSPSSAAYQQQSQQQQQQQLTPASSARPQNYYGTNNTPQLVGSRSLPLLSPNQQQAMTSLGTQPAQVSVQMLQDATERADLAEARVMQLQQRVLELEMDRETRLRRDNERVMRIYNSARNLAALVESATASGGSNGSNGNPGEVIAALRASLEDVQFDLGRLQRSPALPGVAQRHLQAVNAKVLRSLEMMSQQLRSSTGGVLGARGTISDTVLLDGDLVRRAAADLRFALAGSEAI